LNPLKNQILNHFRYKAVYGSPSLKQFEEIAKKEESLLIEGLWDAPKALLLKLVTEATGKNCIVITSESRESKLFDDCPYFGMKEIFDFPSWETLPGEEITPSPDIVGKRLSILHTLLSGKGPFYMLAPLQAVLQRTGSPDTLRQKCHKWKKGDAVNFSELGKFLTDLGYRRSAVVADKGEFALRGGIVDIFPLASSDPYRIEFFGNTLEGIRTFDPIGQKSIAKAETVFLCPAQEFELLKHEKKTATVFDYLGPETVVIFDDLLSLEDKYVALQSLSGAKSSFFLTFDDLMKAIKGLPRIFWTKESVQELSDVRLKQKVGRAFYTGKEPLQPLSFEIFHQEIETKRWRHPFLEVQGMLPTLERSSNLDVHFITSTESEEKALKEKITPPKQAKFERGYLSSGFALTDSSTVLVPMTELTHRYKVRRQKWRSTYHTPASDFHELVPGDLVVHFHNGIGKFLGMEKKKNHLGQETEFLSLEYAEKSKLYVPISQAYLVSRYIGAHEEVPTLHTLGTKQWQKTKLHAQKAIIGYAQDLLRMNAERTVKGGFAFPDDTHELKNFENDFPYVETEDQIQAIAAVKSDMTSPKAMDRLICGDVGYGKTEVAMRAAFKAVADGKKQVAVLVPTTVLALQHFETFTDRMANYPIIIRAISRFHTPKEVKQTLKDVADGKVDILIGTHRLISKDVVFNDLGLIVIDEEQRFGVRAKEHLKTLKTGVDCLTLTATPIPRTLYLSLVGAREISLINTPPQDRLPIKTIISERDPELVHNALLRELSRDGQAFFIHNRVESIFQVSEELQKLLPEARIVTGHGQMAAEELDAVFHQFKSGNADIFVSTTIIENGIDIPNANTILIDRADQFGLADLYQLRGRVGRWNRPAYAYFLTPKGRTLPELSRKRLFALLEAPGYGGGMKIAMRDLEIRGAGDILGTQQSGQIASIGFHLYCKLLKRTIDALQKQAAPSFTETKMEFSFDARLPEEYIGETSLRLEIYHRLGEAASFDDVDAILAELKDRFGPCPSQVSWLIHLTRIRIAASKKRFILLKFNSHTLYTEQQEDKKVVRKTFSLPPCKKPEELERAVLKVL
jgi:transcription-repair coupling factor (superfamily II helicase)